jgi:hypothetical protein
LYLIRRDVAAVLEDKDDVSEDKVDDVSEDKVDEVGVLEVEVDVLKVDVDVLEVEVVVVGRFRAERVLLLFPGGFLGSVLDPEKTDNIQFFKKSFNFWQWKKWKFN